MLICPLCKKEIPFFKSNSHVIPEWMYKEAEVYDEKGRTIEIDNLKTSKPKMGFIQKGYRGDFICEDCEKETAKLDSYASLIFKSGDSYPKRVTKEQKFTNQIQVNSLIEKVHFWSGFNFKKIQNFIYSICLRQHFYNLSKGKKGIIIDRHLHSLLELYRSDFTDDESYPIYIWQFDKEDELYKSIIPPHTFKMSGHYVLGFVAGGFEFIIKTSSHHGLFDSRIRLKCSGSIYIGEIKPEGSGMLKQAILQFQDNFLKTK